MRKLILVAIIVALTAGFVACVKKSNSLTLKGSELSADGDIYVHDMAKNVVIDTIKVNGGKFTYTYTVNEPKILFITNNQMFNRFMVAESGDITFVGDTGAITGTPLNNRLVEFSKVYRNAGDEFELKNQAILNKAESEGRDLTEQEYEELRTIGEKQAVAYSTAIKKFYDKDKNNILGAYELFQAMMFLSEDEFADWYGQGGEAVKNFKIFVTKTQMKTNKTATQAKNKYIDFKGVNPKDTAQIIKLSDFAGKGKYVLLDFWASWCGPCLKAMPAIEMLHKKYADKGLEVIGVVVGDKIVEHLKVAETMNVTWTQIFDNTGEIGINYGIDAIPTLILIDKDGTILIRANEKEEIVAKIESLLK